MKKLFKILTTAFCLVAFSAIPAMACTSYYVGSDCTADGTTMYGRTEDISAAADKVFKVIPAKNVGANAIYKDTTGATDFAAPIHLSKTYRYTVCRDCEGAEDGYFGEVGQNSKGVSMSATTSASPSSEAKQADPFIKDGTGISEENLVDYVLCQAGSAREGVNLIKEVVENIGAGEGNGLFIADKNEVWYVEILTGHNMVATKMPSNKAAIIPNCFMIGEVDLADTENVIASENLIKLASENGFFVDVEKKTAETDAQAAETEATATTDETAAADEAATETTGTTINVKASYAPGYSNGNNDRIRGGQWLLTDGAIDNKAIYEDTYQDMFFDCKGITVEKLYELAGYRYEGMEDVREGARNIGVASSVECHIMQISKDMPAELATVQWLSMCNADFSTFVPFYTAVMTDTSDIYKLEAFNHTTDAAYWVYRDLGAYGAMSREKVGNTIKNTWKSYMLKMQDLQKTVNSQMLDIYNNDKKNLEYYATGLGMAIGEETYDYAKTMLNECAKFVDKADGNPGGSRKAFETTVDFSDLTYDISMVSAPQKKVSVAKTHVKSTVSKKGKKLTVKLDKVKGASGYEIKYSTNCNFPKNITKTLKTKSASFTVKSLKSGKSYYVKARAYKTVDGKKVYGNWSWIKHTNSIKK